MRIKTLVSGLLCSAIVAIHGCAGYTTSRPSYDGETLFRGLIFGVGPAASEFPEIWDRAETRCSDPFRTSSGAVRIQETVMARVRVDDPQFFQTFGSQMRSGDHLRVRAALEQASSLTRSAVSREFFDGDKPPTFEQGMQSGIAGRGITVVVVIHIHAAIAKTAYLWVWNDFWFPDPFAIADGRPTAQLSRDVLVDLVVRRLSDTDTAPPGAASTKAMK